MRSDRVVQVVEKRSRSNAVALAGLGVPSFLLEAKRNDDGSNLECDALSIQRQGRHDPDGVPAGGPAS